MLPFSSLKAASPALAHPSNRHGVVTLTPEEFAYGFVNTSATRRPPRRTSATRCPRPGRILYEAGFANFALHPPTDVHFKNDDRAPLLIVGAEQDHTVPASVSRAQYKKYEHSRRGPTTWSSRAARTCSSPGGLGRGRRGDRRLARRRAGRGLMDLGLQDQASPS